MQTTSWGVVLKTWIKLVKPDFDRIYRILSNYLSLGCCTDCLMLDKFNDLFGNNQIWCILFCDRATIVLHVESLKKRMNTHTPTGMVT